LATKNEEKPESLHDAEDAEERDGLGEQEAGRGDHEEHHPERHEDATADPVEPEADQWLADDAGRAVHALDEADLRLRPSEPLT
jgi:hypothetical protein